MSSLLPLYYLAARNTALKRIQALKPRDIDVLTILYQLNAPCHYKRLFDLLNSEHQTIADGVLLYVLRRNEQNKFITRTPVAGNVLYCITLEGKKILYSFTAEMNAIVEPKIKQYGNGFR